MSHTRSRIETLPSNEDVSNFRAWTRWFRAISKFLNAIVQRQQIFQNSNSTTPDFLLPDGWTGSRTGVGTYLVTHNFGNTDYGVIATANVPTEEASISSNSFTLRTRDSSGTLVDSYWTAEFITFNSRF